MVDTIQLSSATCLARIARDLSPMQMIFTSMFFSFFSAIDARIALATLECTAPHKPRSLDIAMTRCLGFVSSRSKSAFSKKAANQTILSYQ